MDKNTTPLSVERENRALLLHCSGLTYPEIAEQMEMSVSGVHDAVKRALRKRSLEGDEALAELRARHSEILRMVIRGQMPKVVKGEARAGEVVVRALEREAKMYGADAVVKLDVKVTERLQAEIDELVSQMESLDVQEAVQDAARLRG
jgi:DNA-binding CsgD family transcriptional regulator